ncbi:uncharacterized protein LOC132301756 [Cornus florida]|uniref:uncharacterized protein LOC132301756 n=1 Tax=Cornus florida TaxID=4283 RepID=UPI002897D4E2|nr:uncharacterized protein LOC132301756 [Cornus florida]
MVVNLTERRMRNFIWGYVEDKKKMHRLCWKKLAAPKEKEGLGLRRIVDIDLASKCNLACDFLLSKDRIWVAWFERCYLKQASFWNMVPKVTSSSIWKSIIVIRGIMKGNCKYKIRNGQNIEVFIDPWYEGQFLGDSFSHRLLRYLNSNKMSCLSEFIVNNQWDDERMLNTNQEVMQLENTWWGRYFEMER